MASSMRDLKLFMAAIRRLESGSYNGNYAAVGVPTESLGRALGAYQIMSANWGSWARQAGIAGADWRDSSAQDTVAEHKFTQYFNRYQDWGLVAIAWFGGPGAANKAEDNFASVAGRTDVLGTSIGKYVSLIETYMDKAPDVYKTPDRKLVDFEGIDPGQPGRRFVAEAVDTSLNPTFDAQAFLDEYLSRTGTPEEAPVPQIRAPLVGMLELLSNQIAGGQRMSISDASARVKELSLQQLDEVEPETVGPEGEETQEVPI